MTGIALLHNGGGEPAGYHELFRTLPAGFDTPWSNPAWGPTSPAGCSRARGAGA